MGIQIFAGWKGQTEAEVMAQYASAFCGDGRIGYLREAYHGEPYATKYLCREAFESPTGRAKISATTLKERLPETLLLAEERAREVYGMTERDEIAPELRSFRAFVALCEEKEAETGEPVTIVASY